MLSGTVIRMGITVLAALAVFAADAACLAGSLELTKKTKDYAITVRLDRNPPVVGINPLEITILDGSGGIVSDAAVLVNYYMPPMPRMAPMNYKVPASFKRGKYRTDMNFIMEGPWVIAVKINRGGKPAGAKFNVDAR